MLALFPYGGNFAYWSCYSRIVFYIFVLQINVFLIVQTWYIFSSNCVASFHIPFDYSIHPEVELLLTAFLWFLHMPRPFQEQTKEDATRLQVHIFSYHAWHEIKYDQQSHPFKAENCLFWNHQVPLAVSEGRPVCRITQVTSCNSIMLTQLCGLAKDPAENYTRNLSQRTDVPAGGLHHIIMPDGSLLNHLTWVCRDNDSSFHRKSEMNPHTEYEHSLTGHWEICNLLPITETS